MGKIAGMTDKTTPVTIKSADPQARKMGFTIRWAKRSGVQMKRFGQHSMWFGAPTYATIEDALADARRQYDATQALVQARADKRDAEFRALMEAG